MKFLISILFGYMIASLLIVSYEWHEKDKQEREYYEWIERGEWKKQLQSGATFYVSFK